MEWAFNITYDRKSIRLLARVIYQDEQIERIKVIAKNKYIIIQSNRPFLEAKGLRQKRINWKLIDGTISNSSVLELILKHVERGMRHNSELL